jgi:AcrR family transcriptional regulator
MPRANPEARQRLVATAADMLRRRGLNATSIRDLAKAANTPLGSTYHYFPGGKKQVIIEALNYNGDKASSMIRSALKKGPLEGLDSFLNLWRDVVLSSNFKASCPVIAVVIEEATTEEVVAAQALAAEIFERWEKMLSESLRDHGVKKKKAEQLATMIVASAEGGLALCRAKKDIKPFEQVSAQLYELVNSAINKA